MPIWKMDRKHSLHGQGTEAASMRTGDGVLGFTQQWIFDSLDHPWPLCSKRLRIDSCRENDKGKAFEERALIIRCAMTRWEVHIVDGASRSCCLPFIPISAMIQTTKGIDIVKNLRDSLDRGWHVLLNRYKRMAGF